MQRVRVLLDISPVTARREDRTGLARVASELLNALHRRGDVDLQTCAWASLKASHDLRIMAATSPELRAVGVQPGCMERWYAHWAFDRNEGRQRSKVVTRLGQAINLARNPLRGVRLTQFQVIHSTYARLRAAVRFAGLPTVITVHDLIPLILPSSRDEAANAAITRRIIDSIRPHDLVACVSEATRNDFLTYTRHPPNNAVVIHNGVDHAAFTAATTTADIDSIRQRFSIGAEPYVLTLSSLAPHKNLATVIAAWRGIATSSKGKLVIAGGRSTAVDSIRLRYGISPADPSIVVTGFVTDGEYRALASGCNAFLFPSLYEGFGLPALEAMAAGAPVIAANTSAIPEVVGEAGVLLDPLDCDAWTAAITAVLSAGRRVAPDPHSLRRSAMFSWDRTAEQYVSLYKRAVESCTAPARAW